MVKRGYHKAGNGFQKRGEVFLYSCLLEETGQEVISPFGKGSLKFPAPSTVFTLNSSGR